MTESMVILLFRFNNLALDDHYCNVKSTLSVCALEASSFLITLV